jgi:HK97 family phage major capsid protein
MPTTLELREQRAAAWAQAQEYLTRSETTELSADDETGWQRALDEVDRLGAIIETRERTEQIDQQFSRIDTRTPPGSTSSDDADPYRRTFERWCRYGDRDFDVHERDLLQANFRAQGTNTGAAGGYTVPEGFWAKVTEVMKYFGGILGNVEVLNTDSGNAIPWPTNDDTGNSGAILDENTQITEQDVVFGQKNLGAYMYTSKLIRVSLQLLQDSGIDIEMFLAKRIGERLGRIMNTHWTTGTGTGQPQGLITGSTTGKTTASATAITYNEIVDLVHSVDVAYRNERCRFMMNDQILGYVRKIRDDSGGAGLGRPLWEPSVQVGVPDSLLGYRVVVNNDMAASIVTTAKTIAFGDPSAAYVARVVNGGQMARLAERYADYLQVGFFGFARADGVVQDSSAVKLLVQA